MQINIQYFGLIAEAVQKTTEVLVIPDACSVVDLQQELLEIYPILKGKEFKIAINHQLESNATTLSEADEIALLPPFAGG